MSELTMEQMKEITLEAFKSVDDATNMDSVVMEMFSAGIPFAKLSAMYKTVGIEEGFIVDPAVVRENIDAEFENAEELDFVTYPEFDEFVESVLEAVQGSTKRNVVTRLKAYCKDNSISVPDKPRSGGTRKPGVGKIASVILDYAKSTTDYTRQGMFDALRPHVKSAKNAYDTVNLYFGIVVGVAGSMDAKETLGVIDNYALLEKSADEVEETEAD